MVITPANLRGKNKRRYVSDLARYEQAHARGRDREYAIAVKIYQLNRTNQRVIVPN